jgi:nucleotide-binding universal stress UspA family protein
MFKHILVPLDGSHLAEAALPAAATLSKMLGSRVTLIHVIEKNAPQEVHGDRHLTDADDACNYLSKIAKEMFSPELNIQTHVHTEGVTDVTKSIVDHSSELEPDLIIMCTHGESGVHKLIVGTIAQRVISRGKMPILLIQPDDYGAAPPTDFSRFLVALDGDEGHERGLTVAGRLAMQTHARLHFITVIPLIGNLTGERAATSKLLPVATQALLDYNETAAANYLQSRVEYWRKQGLDVSAEVRRGDPAHAVVASAEGNGDNLIILGTHGKAGINAFWAGSVTPKIVGQTRLALLLVPAMKS